MRPRLRIGIAVTLLAAGTGMGWIGCSVYDMSLLQDGSSTLTSADAGDRCAHARWPALPAADTPGAGPDDGDFTAALRTISINGSSDGGVKPTGADLDGVCTCTTGGSSCALPPGMKGCDDDAGRDDSVARLFTDLQARSGSLAAKLFTDQGFNQGLATGSYGMLIQVRGYNGLADDTRVNVTVYPSNGTVNATSQPVPARWDGTDTWSVDPSAYFGSGAVSGADAGLPQYSDVAAYVTGGTLVAHVDFPLALGNAASTYLTINLKDAMLVAPLVKDTNGFRVQGGQIVGRWATRDLLTSLAIYPDPTGGTQRLCGTDAFYRQLKTLICSYADISSSSAADDRNPETPCDAVSFALGFDGNPALLGPTVARVASVPGCGATWTDDCTTP